MEVWGDIWDREGWVGEILGCEVNEDGMRKLWNYGDKEEVGSCAVREGGVRILGEGYMGP